MEWLVIFTHRWNRGIGKSYIFPISTSSEPSNSWAFRHSDADFFDWHTACITSFRRDENRSDEPSDGRNLPPRLRPTPREIRRRWRPIRPPDRPPGNPTPGISAPFPHQVCPPFGIPIQCTPRLPRRGVVVSWRVDLGTVNGKHERQPTTQASRERQRPEQFHWNDVPIAAEPE